MFVYCGGFACLKSTSTWPEGLLRSSAAQQLGKSVVRKKKLYTLESYNFLIRCRHQASSHTNYNNQKTVVCCMPLLAGQEVFW